MSWIDRRVGQEVRVAPAQVAGEDEPARPAVLAVIELDDRRAQDVPGVEVGQGHARHDLHGRPVRHALEPLDHPLDVGQLEERLDRLEVRILDDGRCALPRAGSARCRAASRW